MDRVRDRIAARAQRLDQGWPGAVDIEARVVAALHDHLHGIAALVSGTHCPEHFRESLRGERALHLGDLCRLAVEPGTEPAKAVLAAVRELAEAIGYSLVQLEPKTAAVHEAAGALAQHTGAALAKITEALQDGVVTPEEATQARPTAEAVLDAAQRLLAAIRAAEVAPRERVVPLR